MQPLEQRIYEALAAGSPNTEAGTRVSPAPAKQGDPLPRITLSVVSTAPVNSLSGSSGLDQVRVQVDCWATSKPQAERIARQARSILEAQDFKALMQNRFDAYEVETETHRYSMDFRCWDHWS